MRKSTTFSRIHSESLIQVCVQLLSVKSVHLNTLLMRPGTGRFFLKIYI